VQRFHFVGKRQGVGVIKGVQKLGQRGQLHAQLPVQPRVAGRIKQRRDPGLQQHTPLAPGFSRRFILPAESAYQRPGITLAQAIAVSDGDRQGRGGQPEQAVDQPLLARAVR